MKTINDTYLENLQNILKNGHNTYKDDLQIKELLGNYVYIPDPLGLNYKVKYKTFTPEMLLDNIIDGKYDIVDNPIQHNSLYKYVKSLDNPDDEGFTYTYPNRILEHFGVNQKETCFNRLTTNQNSNRAIIVTLDPLLDKTRESIPCLQLVQFIVRGGELTIHCFFRSNDAYGAFYANMYFITYLALEMIQELNKELREPVIFGGIHYYSTSLHIYKRDLKASQKIINQIIY